MRNAVLIIDDTSVDRQILYDMLCDEYVIYTANDGEEALDIIREHRDEILAILLDLIMPGMNGYELLEKLQTMGVVTETPILIISAEESAESEEKCIDLGAADYVHKPFSRRVVRSRLLNAARLYSDKRELKKTVESQVTSIRKRSNNLILLLAGIVETRDVESGTHVKRVQGYTEILAKKLMEKFPEYNLDADRIKLIVSGSALHDVGKIGIRDAILLKEGKLTDEEFNDMKKHTTIGANFIENSVNVWDGEYLEVLRDIVKYHHEKYDGRGYPEGLKGDEIPISAQIVSIADVFDALVNKRCYKEAYSKQSAFDMIVNGECGEFNPDLIECFRDSFDQFKELADRLDA